MMQRIGRSLMLPVAVLPAAALLVRLGNEDMLGRDSFPEFVTRIAGYMYAGGNALLDNMPLLFAVGIAIGFAKKADGSTALAAVTGYLVFKSVLGTFTDKNLPQVAKVIDGKIVMQDAPVDAKVLGGVVMGIVVALLYQRFYRTKLPDWAGFFGGRRLVPILSAFAGLVIGVLFGFIWPVLGTGLHNFGEWLVGSGAVGAGIFGVANRALIPVGMHHLLNSFPWLQAGTYEGKSGDIARFLAGDPTAGQFMTGFLPDHDVRAARRLSGDRALRPARAPQGRRRHDALPRADLVRHRCDRADRVHLHVHRPGAVRGPRGAHRCVDGADLGTRHEGRLRLLRRSGGLPAEPRYRVQAAGAAARGGLLRGGVLRGLPVRDHPLQSADAGPGVRRGAGGDPQGRGQV
ncbi:PtsC2 protein, partial [Streptomyces clavuligerus]